MGPAGQKGVLLSKLLAGGTHIFPPWLGKFSPREGTSLQRGPVPKKSKGGDPHPVLKNGANKPR